MTEKPILFSGPMVRTILEGRKTQTRRMVRPDLIEALGDPDTWEPQAPGHWRAWSHHENQNWHFGCPYGQSGDHLWVRETWAAHFMYDDVAPSSCPRKGEGNNYWYAADPEGTSGTDGCPADGRRGRWRPSIHMPRWASRLTLEVTEVRVQRLQEISEEDARAEGVLPTDDHFGEGREYWECDDKKCVKEGGCAGVLSARKSFETLWDSISGERPGCSWEANPFVWAISFTRCK